MPKSIRVLTEIGKDKSVQVDLNQEFDFLEILSLKFSQSELYQRMCADYGVVVGRISVNNGYGLPNAKLSIFIPLTDEDSQDPIISELYPYKSLGDTNIAGYQYNLLPQTRSHSNHVPTGSFPTKEQIMTDQGWKKVFDKYYKYTVVTNQSGDFMMFGLPLGQHKIVMNIDLSDIGEFSLTPQDLIRMGRATESQVDGVRFKASTNFKELPQIVTIVKEVTVLPLWGEQDVCQSSINRTDFDLSDEGNITIQPTAIFMGSMISTLDKYALSKWRNNFCRVKLKTGELCKLTTGPGEILAIRHTIQQDTNGRPILEQYFMENNGKCIDGDGTWLVELPMNLNYVITDQFGNQVPSLDPSVGIPTTGRYRFKIKWQQPDNFDQDVKRAYFLVPNIKEWGWTSSNDDPNLQGAAPSPTSLFTKSYSFSLDWDDYGDTSPDGIQMINEAINCDDRFYEFYYNKVYTVSQLIDQYRGGVLNRRYNSIKNILEEECESEVLKFPTNDSQWRPDFIYLVFSIFLRVATPVMFIVMIVLHIIGFLLWLLQDVLTIVMCVINMIVFVICWIVYAIVWFINVFGAGIDLPDCIDDPWQQCVDFKDDIKDLIESLKYFPLPNLTYPDCEMCNCEVKEAEPQENFLDGTQIDPQSFGSTISFTELSNWQTQIFYDNTLSSAFDCEGKVNTPYLNYLTATGVNFNPNDPPVLLDSDSYNSLQTRAVFPSCLSSVMAGRVPLDTTGDTATLDAFCPIFVAKPARLYTCDQTQYYTQRRIYFSSDIPMAGKLNMFNSKYSYFRWGGSSLSNTTLGSSFAGVNQFSTTYQSPNQIKVQFNYTANTDPTQFHYDNIILLSCDSGSQGQFAPGTIVTFQGPSSSNDVNALSGSTDNDEGIPCITGTTRITPSANGTIPISIRYAKIDIGYTNFVSQAIVNTQYGIPISPSWHITDNFNSTAVGYTVVSSTADTAYHRWPIDIEYFQVITAMTITQYKSHCFPNPSDFGIVVPSLSQLTCVPHYQFNVNDPYYNSLPARFIFNNMTIREFTNGNIVRPDFWTYPRCDFESSIPVWGPPCNINRLQTYAGVSFRNTPPRVLWETQSIVNGASEGNNQVLVFLVRGVDPYSTRNLNKYDLSPLFGRPYGRARTTVTGMYKLNLPIQPGLFLPRHNQITSNDYTNPGYKDTTQTQQLPIYFQNFNYKPGDDFSGFTSYTHRFYSAMDKFILNKDMGNSGNNIALEKGGFVSNSSGLWGTGFLAVKGPNPNSGIDNDSSFLGSRSDTYQYNDPNGNDLIPGVGLSPRIVLPIFGTKSSNLFTTTFDWHAGNGLEGERAAFGARYRIDQWVNGGSWNNTGDGQFSNMTWFGKFANQSVQSGIANPCSSDGWLVTLGGSDSDGYWLPRLNTNVLFPSSGPNTYSLTTTPTYNGGYYPNQIVDGGELYTFNMTGAYYGQYEGPGAPIPPDNLGFAGTNRMYYPNGTPNYNALGYFWSYQGLAPVENIGDYRTMFNLFYHGTNANTNLDEPVMRLFSCSYHLPYTSNPFVPSVTLNNYPLTTMFNGLTFDVNATKNGFTLMRTDRLPTSDRTFEIRNYNDPDIINLSYIMHNNPNFAIYTFDDQGTSLSNPPIVLGQNFPSDPDVSATTAPSMSSVIGTLNECSSLLPLNCYYNETISLSGQVEYSTIQVDPNRPWRDGTCTSQDIGGFGDRMIFDTDTGCYQLVSRFLLSIPIDFELLMEWKNRLDITFAACRNVFSHVFTNQWVNGVLYAYAIKNEKKIDDRTNQVTGYRYCYDTIFLHPITNSFFYRSSPWNGTFIGKKGNTERDGGNRKYLNNPTTILDLGPKTDYLQQLVLSDKFDGYIAKDLRDSTFGDTSDILNFFILSRLMNVNFFQQLFGVGGAGILGFFTRVPRGFAIQPRKQKNFVDSDFAQLISINSELGVDEFDVGNYPVADSMYYYAGNNANETVIGIFYNSNQQVRDFLTPRRTIYNSTTSQSQWFPPPGIGLTNSFAYIPGTKTQYVPFYNWRLEPIDGEEDVFGSQQNDWNTGAISAYYYQTLDRLNNIQQSNYMSPKPNTNVFSRDYRGFIFNYNQTVNLYDPDLQDTNPYFTGDYSNNGNTINKNVLTHGAPFHFYFGLKKGKTALDRFLTKYTQDTDLI